VPLRETQKRHCRWLAPVLLETVQREPVPAELWAAGLEQAGSQVTGFPEPDSPEPGSRQEAAAMGSGPAPVSEDQQSDWLAGLAPFGRMPNLKVSSL